uniref:Uncharacterized protein n=1 Tax=Meloidogyne javanica TaxID=6303 RepID=A0A915M147_MELJA
GRPLCGAVLEEHGPPLLAVALTHRLAQF